LQDEKMQHIHLCVQPYHKRDKPAVVTKHQIMQEKSISKKTNVPSSL